MRGRDKPRCLSVDTCLVAQSAERCPLSHYVRQRVSSMSRSMTNLGGLEVEANVDKVEAAPSSPSFLVGLASSARPNTNRVSRPSPTTSHATRRDSSTQRHLPIRNHRSQAAHPSAREPYRIESGFSILLHSHIGKLISPLGRGLPRQTTTCFDELSCRSKLWTLRKWEVVSA